MFGFFTAGGWVMWPLLACSLISLAIILERLIWGPKRKQVIPPEFVKEVSHLISQGRLQELLGLCRASNAPIAEMILTALKHAQRPRAELQDAVQLTGRKIAAQLQRHLPALNIIAAISPLLGLLGTVSGMIATFAVIEQVGIGSAAKLAGGIAQALNATASGLIVAIPTIVFHRSFVQQSRSIVLEMEEIALHVIDDLQALERGESSKTVPPKTVPLRETVR